MACLFQLVACSAWELLNENSEWDEARTCIRVGLEVWLGTYQTPVTPVMSGLLE